MANLQENHGLLRLVQFDNATDRAASTNWVANDVNSVVAWDGTRFYLLRGIASNGTGLFDDLITDGRTAAQVTAEAETVAAAACVRAGMLITASETITIASQDVDVTITFESNVAGDLNAVSDATGDDDLVITTACQAIIMFQYDLQGAASKSYDLHISSGGTPLITQTVVLAASGNRKGTLIVPASLAAAAAITAEIQNNTDTADATLGPSSLTVFGIQTYA